MKRLLPVLFILALAIVLAIGVNYLDKNTETNEIKTSQMEAVERVVLIYDYYTPTLTENANKLTIEITEQEQVKALTKSFESLDITDYSDKVGLIISGIYQVDFENGTKILFDSNTDEYASLIKDEKKSLIKIPTEFKDTIIKKVDEKLTEKAMQYQTDKITIIPQVEQENQEPEVYESIEPIEGTEQENIVNNLEEITDTDVGEETNQLEENTIPKGAFVIEDKYALQSILEDCKNIATSKNANANNFVKDYEIDFNNGIRIEVFIKECIGKMHKENQGVEIVKLPVGLVDLISNRIDNEKSGKTELFNVEMLTIEHNGIATDITDIEKVQGITQRLMYSKIAHLNYLDSETFKIETTPEDYILNINNCRIVIYGNPNYASRQIIYQDGTYDDITLMKGLEEYIKTLVNVV